MAEDGATARGRPPLLPLFVDIAGQPCLVVGAGKVAARKTAALLRAGAAITVVAPESGPEMDALRLSHGMVWHARRYRQEDLAGQRLVIAATADVALNEAIAEAAKGQGLLVNVADPGHLGNAIIPAVIDRAPLQVAVFSGGASPALARQLHRQLDAYIPKTYGRLAAFAGALRAQVRQVLPEQAQRQRFWRSLLSGPAATEVLAGNEDRARRLAQEQLAAQSAAGSSDAGAEGSHQ